jgi:hypothetical protein
MQSRGNSSFNIHYMLTIHRSVEVEFGPGDWETSTHFSILILILRLQTDHVKLPDGLDFEMPTNNINKNN